MKAFVTHKLDSKAVVTLSYPGRYFDQFKNAFYLGFKYKEMKQISQSCHL